MQALTRNEKSAPQFRPPSWKKCDILTSFSLSFVAPEGTYPRGVRDAFRQLVSIFSPRYPEMRFRPSSPTADGPTERVLSLSDVQ